MNYYMDEMYIKMNGDELKQKINGIEELKTMIGTRKEIYNFIASQNSFAVDFDCRDGYATINGVRYAIVLKKVNGGFKVRMLLDCTPYERSVEEIYVSGKIVPRTIIERYQYIF